MKFYYPIKKKYHYDIGEVESDGAINYEVIKYMDVYYYRSRNHSIDVRLFESKDDAWNEAFRLMNLLIRDYTRGMDEMIRMRTLK